MYIINIAGLHMCAPVAPRALAGAYMSHPSLSIADAWLHVDDGRIVDFGPMATLDRNALAGHEVIDATGRHILPTFCDSHTHIIYAGSRHGEFLDKINGLSYEEIARRGGGILNSADLLAATPEDELYEQSVARARRMIACGTGSMEIKTGYGLTTDAEIKMLRVAARIREAVPARVRITFLGAHAVSRKYVGRQAEYVDMLISDMLPAVAAEGIAEYVDVFCDQGFFTTDETARILDASAHYGLRPKIHANELACSGGVQVGVAHGAVSVDHLERAGAEELALLSHSDTVATMLPGASFFLGMPYGPARATIDAGCRLALASDYNPGSSPSGDMRFVWALGCIKMRLRPIEALAACTAGGAAAMLLTGHPNDPAALTAGIIAPGADASFIITRPIPALEYIPYAYTAPWIDRIYLHGHPVA